jgi:hypothetical protein
MATVTLDRVIAEARELTPDDQARLITALLPTASMGQTQRPGSTVTDDDAAEQRETWAYLQRALDEDRLSDRPLFPAVSHP